MRNFGASDRMTKIMETFGMKEGEELEHPWLNKSVETAQKRVEQRNYLTRKRTLEFDDVMNQQREVIYGFRNEAIESDEPRTLVYETIDQMVPQKAAEFLDIKDEPDAQGLLNWINTSFPLGLTLEKADFASRSTEENGKWLVERIKAAYETKCSAEDPLALKGLERYIILNAVDRLWQEHLYAMDGLRDAVYLRAYAQKDPLVEYKNEAYLMFSELMNSIRFEILNNLFRSTTNLQAFEAFLANLPHQLSSADGPVQRPIAGSSATPDEDEPITLPIRREIPKVGRNDPCPCGSGKKFKNCCGR